MMKKYVYSVLVLMLPLIAAAQRYIEVGPWYRGNMKIGVRGGSIAADEGAYAALPGTRGGTAQRPQFPEDNGTDQILRIFDNGYVGPSGWAWANAAGTSQHFGYQHASQYDPAGSGTLSFTLSTSGSDRQRRTITTVSSGQPGWSGHERVNGVGAQATLGYRLQQSERFDFSVLGQFGWLGGIEASFRDQQAWQQDVTWTTHESTASRLQVWQYEYDTLGNPVFPGAPYEMTDPSGVGPMISDTPTRIIGREDTVTQSDSVVGRHRASAYSTVDLNADINLLSFMLGSRMGFRPVERVALVVQGGVTFNFIDAALRRTERLVWDDGTEIARWTRRENNQEWCWGGRVSAGAQVDVTDRMYLSGLAGYDWIQSADFTVGPDRIDVDLSGYHVELAIGLSF